MSVRFGVDDLVDDLLAHGRHSITTADAALALGVPGEQVRVRFARLREQGRVFSPARGLWVLVPPQFRNWRTLPGLQFLDDLMRHLGREYYVGWLSAAEIHGAAHQRPQVLQVAVDSHVADRDVERVHLRFVQRRHVTDVPRLAHTTPTGRVWVSSPELTALDLVDDQRLAGGINNATTVIAELADEDQLDAGRIAEVARRLPLAAARRLGFVLEFQGVAGSDLTTDLHQVTDSRRHFPPDLLSTDAPAAGPTDSRWRLVVNTTLEPDL